MKCARCGRIIGGPVFTYVVTNYPGLDNGPVNLCWACLGEHIGRRPRRELFDGWLAGYQSILPESRSQGHR